MGSISTSKQEMLQTAIEEVHQNYIKKNPVSKKIYDEACQYMPGGNTRTVLYTTPFPLAIQSGYSCYLTTADGAELIDFLGEYTAGIYGHNHPIIRQAVESALDRGWNYGGHTNLEPQLARIICERFPAMEAVRFVNSGTEANMMNLATALVYTGRKKVLIFNKGYHGSTISGRSDRTKPSINLPHEFVVGTYNDVDGTTELVDSLPTDSLAAILVEPSMGSGGAFAGSDAFLQNLRRLADKHGALLIFDEVMTSRLGFHGRGAAVGIKPDLMSLGKWVGGGMSFGAFGGRRDIMSLYDPRVGKVDHPGTFNNNVFSMSAGIAGCQLLTAEVLDQLNAFGDKLASDITDVLLKNGIRGDILPTAPIPDEAHDTPEMRQYPQMFVKNCGSMMQIHFVGPDRAQWQGLFYHHMLSRGIYLAQRGFMALNIELKQEHSDKFVQEVESFVEKWQKQLVW